MRHPCILLPMTLMLAVIGFSCQQKPVVTKPDALSGAFGVEADWNDPQHQIPLDYQQAQGQRVFYTYCVWCHADSSPAGPSNRSNVTPIPPLANDGATFNTLSDETMRNTITLGGSAMGRSPMMPPWGNTLTQDEVQAVMAFMRAIAQPAYRPPVRQGPQYSVK
jgi:mono/diheme cytochrome c family protein